MPMEKLNFLGVGPKIARIAIPCLAVAITLTILFPEKLTFGKAAQQPLLIAGIVLLILALVMYIATLLLMIPAIRKNRLVTGGTYRLCRNPLYAALILFLIPGLALILNSWIVLTTSIVAYFLFRRFVHEEEELLDRIFGEEFRKYREQTSCFFPDPFPKK
jgi:protein-S-isoprenylcysteine O-methyltransferase Ste14